MHAAEVMQGVRDLDPGYKPGTRECENVEDRRGEWYPYLYKLMRPDKIFFRDRRRSGIRPGHQPLR